jgi:hypothetical protein
MTVAQAESHAARDAELGDADDEHASAGAEPENPRPARLVRRDLLVAAGYLLVALYLTVRLWADLKHRVLSSFPPDQYLFEFWLSHTARVFTHGENPFFTAQLNAPMGVNVMANTATFGMTLPLVPVTLLFGPQASFAVMVTAAPFLTALGWYWLFSRRLVKSRWAAAIGGGFCGFAPGVAAQDNVHPNLAMQFAIPLILWQVLRLRDGGRPVRTGLVLGLLVVYQFFINEELLLMTAFACLTFALFWAAFKRAEARRAVRGVVTGLAVAGGLAVVLLAYPMWYQFFGPQHYRGFGSFADLFGSDIASFTAFPTHSLAGGAQSVRLAGTVVEENAFFGWPLLVMAIVWAAMLWRRIDVRAAVITGVLFAAASLGSHLHVGGKVTHVPAPWWLVAHLPLLDSIIATRLALAVIPVIGMLVALILSRLLTPTTDVIGRRLQMLGLAGVLVALVPLIPTPFSGVSRPAVPGFISSGEWRSYVPAGHTLVPLPITSGAIGIAAVQWVAASGAELTIPGGYFIVPDGQGPNAKGIFGPPPRPTSTLFYRIAVTGKAPVVGPSDRRSAIEDLAYWHAAVVVLNPRQSHFTELLTTMTDLIGFAPQWTDGVWLWDVRSLTS